MQIRNRKEANEKIELQMTPMIDIVFQMLVFFVMTFKVVAQEGDFNVRMPRATPSEAIPEEERQTSTLTLRAGNDGRGELVAIQWNDGEIPLGTDFERLHQHIIGFLGVDRGPGSIQASAEVEIVADFDLRYEFVIKAITAVSGYRTPDDQIVKLIEKINFRPAAE